MTAFEGAKETLVRQPRCWLVTGAAGFIGSNLVESLLRLGQNVVGLDNFSTGHRRNLEEAVAAAGAGATERFTLVEGDIRDLDTCLRACEGADVVLHQAALGSVPRSIKMPLVTHEVNATGTLNMLIAARDAGVGRFVYASSSSIYGDHPSLPKVEDVVGTPLSPYAVSKQTGEFYVRTFQSHYSLATIALRYFNVFGRRQDPEGPYAAVIPKWIGQILAGERCTIYGDGETSRDFCYVDNVVQANLLAATADASTVGGVYNVAYGERTTLNELHGLIVGILKRDGFEAAYDRPFFEPSRTGDIRHSLADVTAARTHLGYEPAHDVRRGLEKIVMLYAQNHQALAHESL